MRFSRSFVEARLQRLPKDYADEIRGLGRVISEEDIEFDDHIGAELLRRFRGAGDVIAAVAKPIAKGIDAVFGTDLLNCGGCAERQEKLNESIPFKKD